MKKITRTVLIIGAMMAASSAFSAEKLLWYNGKVYANGGSQLPADQQANNTWDDWVWRGKWENIVQFCASNSKGCSFTWGTSKSTSYSNMTGWSFEGGFGVSRPDMAEASITAAVKKEQAYTVGQSENFDMRTDLRPGQWAQPVMVAVRRWKKGHFYGGHFYRNKDNGGLYVYDWKWQNYGTWQGNVRGWSYKMIQVTNSRNNL